MDCLVCICSLGVMGVFSKPSTFPSMHYYECRESFQAAQTRTSPPSFTSQTWPANMDSVYKGHPAYIQRAGTLEDSYRLGRSKKLTTYQQKFKSAWRKLAQRPCSGRSYSISIHTWQCSCGQQKYNPFHLCKHLVQSSPSPPPSFFVEIVRRHMQPLYQHPALTPSSLESLYHGDSLDVPSMFPPGSGSCSLWLNNTGSSISDGDDHVWLGDKWTLKGSSGWQDLPDGILGKSLHSSGDGLDWEASPSHSDVESIPMEFSSMSAILLNSEPSEQSDEDEVGLLLLLAYSHLFLVTITAQCSCFRCWEWCSSAWRSCASHPFTVAEP